MRAHFVLPQLQPYYGMEKAATELMIALRAGGVHTSATVLSGDGCPAAESIPTTLLRQPVRATRLAEVLPALRRELVALSRETVIVASGLWAAAPVAAALVGTGRSYVGWEHSLLPRRLPFDRRVHVLSKIFYSRALRPHQVVAVSEGVRATVRAKLPQTLVTTIPNIVDVPLLSPLGRKPAEERVRILATGAFRPIKNYACAIEAMAHLPKNFDLSLAGDGQEGRALREFAQRIGVADRVHFLGRVPDVPRLLGESDLLAHPSLAETFGFSLVEAADAGVPVVTLPVASINELVPDLVPGFMAADLTPTAFANALRLGAEEGVTDDGARKAWEFRRSKLSAPVVATRWQSLFNSVVSATP